MNRFITTIEQNADDIVDLKVLDTVIREDNGQPRIAFICSYDANSGAAPLKIALREILPKLARPRPRGRPMKPENRARKLRELERRLADLDESSGRRSQ